MINKLRQNRFKKKAQQEVDKIFSISDKAANLMLPMPLFIWEVKFEFLFLFYFLHDYRVFHKFDQSFRETIADEFIKRVSQESGNTDTLELAEALYNQRISQYFNMVKTAQTVGDFTHSVARYIEALVVYMKNEERFSDDSPEIILDKVNQSYPDEIGSLAEPISMSISMHSTGLLY